MTYDDLEFTPPIEETGASRIFRRDCLAILYNSIWIYSCHFKVANSGTQRDRTVRRAEALAVRRIIETEFLYAAKADWLMLGDFNIHDADDEADIETLLEPFSIDLTRDMSENERWTYLHEETGFRSCPDRILCSPVMQHRVKSPPTAIRFGLRKLASSEAATARSPRASDHELLWVDLSWLPR